jgi:hypothetical protein
MVPQLSHRAIPWRTSSHFDIRSNRRAVKLGVGYSTPMEVR